MVVRGAPAIGVAAAYGIALAASQRGGPGGGRPRPARVPPDGRQPRLGARRDARRPVLRARRGASTPTRSSAAGAWRRTPPTSSRRGRERSRTATPAASRRAATAAPSARCSRAWERGLLAHVWVDETRPLLQGARLTAWELETAAIPHAVIADSAAASLMAAGEVDCVITGADRIAANGDTANKIGTYSLAVLARHHAIPLYVVAPTSTRRPRTPTGAGDPDRGARPRRDHARFAARNPAFDVTPAALITAIVTEHGVHRAPYRESLAGAVGDGVKALDPRRRVRDAAPPAHRHVARSSSCRSAAGRSSTGSSTAIAEVDEVDEIHVVTNSR